MPAYLDLSTSASQKVPTSEFMEVKDVLSSASLKIPLEFAVRAASTTVAAQVMSNVNTNLL